MSLLSRTKDLLNRQPKKSAKSSKKKTKASPAKIAQSEGVAGKPSAPATSVSEVAARIGLTPLVTEKGMQLQAQAQTAVFRVVTSANKHEIARAVEEQYNVKPLSVRTVRMRGKLRIRGRAFGTTPTWKKAYVQVEDIQKLHVNP